MTVGLTCALAAAVAPEEQPAKPPIAKIAATAMPVWHRGYCNCTGNSGGFIFYGKCPYCLVSGYYPSRGELIRLAADLAGLGLDHVRDVVVRSEHAELVHRVGHPLHD